MNHEPRSAAWWRTVAANGDLPDLADAWRAEQAPAPAQQPAGRVLPPWCGKCQGEPVAMRYQDRDDGRSYRCPNCHPDTAPTWAAKPAKRSGGHQPWRNPTDPSVYDLDFWGRPAAGTDSQQPA